jgi:hypothetical protein
MRALSRRRAPLAAPLAPPLAPLAALVMLGASCQEEALQQLRPAISLCPAAGAPAADCDRTVDLGEVPVTVETELTLFVRDTGGARLEVTEVTTTTSFVTVTAFPDEVFAGREAPLVLSLLLGPEALGPQRATVTVASDDPERPLHELELVFVGVPKPAPDILVCTGDAEPVCGTELEVSFGVVRRSQQQGLSLLVKNTGTAALFVSEVRLEGETTAEGEITIATSTRPARLAPGDTAPLVVVYRPADGVEDSVALVIVSDDEDTPEARVRLTGSAADNLPPVALAFETLSEEATAGAVIDDVVQLDGSLSLDPEGDPLRYSWSLLGPAGSRAALDDPEAVRASFVPDVAGLYTATLVVSDSLGQESPPAEVRIAARPRFGFRAQLSWAEGGDLDLHLVEQGQAVFGPGDCSFENRRIDVGANGLAADDCVLLDDAVAPPGPEQAVIAVPAPGTWELWVHVFDAGGLAVIEATTRIVLDDAAEPVMLEARQLPGACALWHVADISFPSGAVTVVEGAVDTRCR